MYADMHIHSFFSDGTMSPEDIVQIANTKDVSLISIADHNVLDAWDTFPTICSQHGLQCISGVELNSQWEAITCHILAYGYDLQNAEFRNFVSENRSKLDKRSDKLIAKMAIDHPAISIEDYARFIYNPNMGGWKAINYLLDRGLSNSQFDSLRYYNLYGCSYEECGFLSVPEICKAIKSAGGTPVLAHPGEYVPLDDAFSARLDDLRFMGIEGLECFYPLHHDTYTAACLQYCKQHDWIVTCGSDFHGTFLPDTEICKLKIPLERLNLKWLNDRII
jgi:3',5'-nucleoside bisphosphate phosphatase